MTTPRTYPIDTWTLSDADADAAIAAKGAELWAAGERFFRVVTRRPDPRLRST